jgi:hypothetical protein
MPTILLNINDDDYEKLLKITNFVKIHNIDCDIHPYHGNHNVTTDSDLIMESMVVHMVKSKILNASNTTEKILEVINKIIEYQQSDDTDDTDDNEDNDTTNEIIDYQQSDDNEDDDTNKIFQMLKNFSNQFK